MADCSNPAAIAVNAIECGVQKVTEDGANNLGEQMMAGYDQLMKECCIEPEDAIRDGLPPEWNSLEIYEPGKTGLLHYTDMHLQPWVSRHNPNGEIWEIYLKSAIRDGFITWDEVQDNLKKGFIRPSLVWQMKLPRSSWASRWRKSASCCTCAKATAPVATMCGSVPLRRNSNSPQRFAPCRPCLPRSTG